MYLFGIKILSKSEFMQLEEKIAELEQTANGVKAIIAQKDAEIKRLNDMLINNVVLTPEQVQQLVDRLTAINESLK